MKFETVRFHTTQAVHNRDARFRENYRQSFNSHARNAASITGFSPA